VELAFLVFVDFFEIINNFGDIFCIDLFDKSCAMQWKCMVIAVDFNVLM